MIVDNDLLSVQQARILAENAQAAQRVLSALPQERLDAMVEAMAAAVEEHAQSLALMSHEETGYGRWQDKLTKNLFACRRIPEQLRNMRCVGVTGLDHANRIVEVGVPVGVIAVLCPSTSPVSTTINAALIAIKSGNAMVVSPHPHAVRSIARVMDIMAGAAVTHGLPEGSLGYLRTVAASGTRELLHHPAVSLVLISGVPGMLRAAQEAGKPLIYGDTGNGPAFIERSADIRQAVANIIRSKTFDHGIAPSAEQSVVVDSCVAERVRQALCEQGAYFLSGDEMARLGELLFCIDGRHRAGMVGVSADALARRAGFAVPDGTRVLVAERNHVSGEDPYSRELLCPVLALYIEDDWQGACEKCIELLLHERKSHTLVIHSTDDAVIRQFVLKKPVARVLVNAPASLGGMGAATDLFPSLILGSGSVGSGITADNVSPRNLTYTRKVGYGQLGCFDQLSSVCTTPSPVGGGDTHKHPQHIIHDLHRVLMEAIKVMDDPADR